MTVRNFTSFFKRLLFLLTLCCATAGAFAQGAARQITGKVTDESGTGVSGVTVTVKGTQTATQTDANGVYTINAPGNATLVFSSVGFGTSTVDVRGRSTVNTALSTQSSNLNEVVVVGY